LEENKILTFPRECHYPIWSLNWRVVNIRYDVKQGRKETGVKH